MAVLKNLKNPLAAALDGVGKAVLSTFSKNAGVASKRVGAAPVGGKKAMPVKAKIAIDSYAVRLTPAQAKGIKAKLNDKSAVAKLHVASKASIDKRWGIDPQSPTELQNFSHKKAL